MVRIRFGDRLVNLRDNLNVLEALLDAGLEIPNDCRAGVCQSCLMQATAGPVPEDAQAGLKDTLRSQGYFLACRCHPRHDLEVRLPAARPMCVTAVVRGHEYLAQDILRLRLSTGAEFHYRPGQYLTLWRDERQGRCYSLASVPERDPHLELHIRRIPGGVVSNWAHDQLRTGDRLQIQGPAGECFYVPGNPGRSLLLVGTGTGLAPLCGILRDALHHGHWGEIQLFHGAAGPSGLYLVQELRDMARRCANLHYSPCVLDLQGSPCDDVEVGAVGELALSTVPEPRDWKVYLCGAPRLVNSLRKQTFLAGTDIDDIYADAFVPSQGLKKTA
jgi:CDP-4-dehydro-6-deoxyglucose reductase